MIAKSGPSREFERFIEPHIEAEVFGRPLVPGLALDDEGTRNSEDTIHAKKHRDGSYSFTGSVVEGGLLDRRGESVRYLVDGIREVGLDAELRRPRSRTELSFAHDREIPTLSVVGGFRADVGFYDVDIVRAKINPPLYAIPDPELREHRAFRDTADFVHALQKYEFNERIPGRPSRHMISQNRVVESFANLMNLTAAQLAGQARIPQLLHEYPDEVLIGGRRVNVATVSVNSDSVHADVYSRPYTAVTSPMRSARDWINQVSLSYFMDTGDTLLNYEEAQLVADWMNQKRLHKMERRARLVGDEVLQAAS